MARPGLSPVGGPFAILWATYLWLHKLHNLSFRLMRSFLSHESAYLCCFQWHSVLLATLFTHFV